MTLVIAGDPDVAPRTRREHLAQGGSLVVLDLEEEEPPADEPRRRVLHEPPDQVETIATAAERERRLVVPHVGSDLRPLRVADVGEVRREEIEGLLARDRREEIATPQVDRVRDAMTGDVPRRDRERLLAELDRGDAERRRRARRARRTSRRTSRGYAGNASRG